MSEPTTQELQYSVSIVEPRDNRGTLVFTFVPKGALEKPTAPLAGKRMPQFIVNVRQDNNALAFDWSGSPDDPGFAKEQLEAEVSARMSDRAKWMNNVNSLVSQFEQWAKEIGWSSRRVEKKLDDVRVGEHRLPALLMQEDTYRVMLEPVGRASPGSEGVVDLYLMPAYDDIASLYYYDNRWNLHYTFPSEKPAGSIREAVATPLSKQALEKVLTEMRQHAA